ncbi:YfbM family protein [Actinoplanes sp. TFC3]|uniref:YfbM family protein n=1 Tax=Actinoplanes sp. TFC3 TaxID=1710355 RepID=UPI0008310B4F|nr:YfbM family protein [Actinoplanes sp. TFC3]
MGMTFIGRRLTADEQQDLIDDPKIADDLLFGDLADDADLDNLPEPELDLDKAWHGIHFLLTGSEWDTTSGAGEAVLGGQPIGADGGYGPARLVEPATVRTIAAGLDAWDIEALRSRFDPAAMTAAGVYPNVWDGGMEEFDSYLWPHFEALRRFYRTAAEQGHGVLVVIT